MLDNKRKGAEDYYRQIMAYRKNGDTESADKLELEFRRVAETGGFYENENYEGYLRGLLEDKKMIIQKQANDTLLKKISIVNSSEFRELESKQKKVENARKTTAFWADRLRSEGVTPTLSHSIGAVENDSDMDSLAEYIHNTLSENQRNLVKESITEHSQSATQKNYTASRDIQFSLDNNGIRAFGQSLALDYGQARAKALMGKLDSLTAVENERKDLIKLNNFG